jgi:ABC-type glycerol-3-phosphate transport system substrate-binding protein
VKKGKKKEFLMNISPYLRWACLLALCVLALSACTAATSKPGGATAVKPTSPPAVKSTSAPATSPPKATSAPPATSKPAADPNLVTFVSYAIDPFELRALVQMVEAFVAKEKDVKMNCILIATAQTVANTPNLSTKVCRVVAK